MEVAGPIHTEVLIFKKLFLHFRKIDCKMGWDEEGPL